MSDELLRLSLTADASAATDAINEVSDETKSLSAALDAVGESGLAAGNSIAAGMEKADYSLSEARHSAMLLSEETGVKLPRSLAMVLAKSELIGPALSAAFSGVALIGFAELAEAAAEKLSNFISDEFIFTEAMKDSDRAAALAGAQMLQYSKEISDAQLKLQELGKTPAQKLQIEIGLKGDELSTLYAQLEELHNKAGYLAVNGQKFSQAWQDAENQIVLVQRQIDALSAGIGLMSAQLGQEFDKIALKAQEDFAKVESRVHEAMRTARPGDDPYAASIATATEQMNMQLATRQSINDSVEKLYTTQLSLNAAIAQAAVAEQQGQVFSELRANHYREASAAEKILVANLEKERDAQLAILDAKIEEQQIALQVAQEAGDTAGGNNATAQLVALQAERVKIFSAADEKIAKANAAMNQKMFQDYKGHFSEINSDFTSFFTSVVAGHERIGQAAGKMFQQMEGQMAGYVAKLLEALAEAELLSLLTGGATSFGGAFGSLMKFEHGGEVPSAAGGMLTPDSGPSGGMLALLHPREMVLDEKLSTGIKGMIESGRGGGGDTHIHVHAVDASGVANFFKKNSDALGAGMHKATSDGHFNIQKAVRGK